MVNKEKYLRHPALQMMLKGMRQEQLQKCWFLGIMTFLGLVLFILVAHKIQILAAVGFGVFLICGRFLFIKIKHFKRQEKEFLETIFENPLKVVWVYTLIVQRMPFGFQIAKSGLLYIKLSDGNEFSISLAENELKVASRFLNRLLPEATFGYTDERAQWYNAHPEMLRKED